MSTLLVGVWSAAGEPSERHTAVDTGMAIRYKPGHVRRTPAVRTAEVPGAADGQSADGGLLGVRWARGQAGQPAW